MSKVKAANFGVRFYRRGVQPVAVKKDSSQDNVMDAPKQKPFPKPAIFSMKKRVVKWHVQFNAVAGNGYADFAASNVTAPVVPAPQVQALIIPAAPVQEIQAEKKPMRVRANEQALWAAAYTGDCRMIRILVMEGVDIDARDGEGRTAINIATQYGRKDALKTLLAAKEMRYLASIGKLPDSNFFRKFQPRKTGTQ